MVDYPAVGSSTLEAIPRRVVVTFHESMGSLRVVIPKPVIHRAGMQRGRRCTIGALRGIVPEIGDARVQTRVFGPAYVI
jgi:hypothetical protein